MQEIDAREGCHVRPSAQTKAPWLEKDKKHCYCQCYCTKRSQFLPWKCRADSCRSVRLWIDPPRLDSVLHQLVHAALVDDQRRLKLAFPHQLFETLKESGHEQRVPTLGGTVGLGSSPLLRRTPEVRFHIWLAGLCCPSSWWGGRTRGRNERKHSERWWFGKRVGAGFKRSSRTSPPQLFSCD